MDIVTFLCVSPAWPRTLRGLFLCQNKTNISRSVDFTGAAFLLLSNQGEYMNIVSFIQSNDELKSMPFLIVYRTIKILKEMGLIKNVVD